MSYYAHYDIPVCKCGEAASYRVAKKFGQSSPVWSRKPLYCYDCATKRAMARRQLEIDERNARIAKGQAKDCDVLMGLAEDIREEVTRKLADAGYVELSRLVAATPIVMNSQYTRVLGRAWYGEGRRIEWSLKAYQNAHNVTHGDFRRTLLHEWAHILDFAHHGRSSGHGRGWQKFTHFLGISEATAYSMVYASRRVKRMARTEEMDQAVDNDRALRSSI